MEAQSFLQNLPFSWTISKSHPSETLTAARFTRRAAVSTSLPWLSSQTTVRLAAGGGFWPRCCQSKALARGVKEVSYFKKQVWYAVLYTALLRQFYDNFNSSFSSTFPEDGELHLIKHSCTETLCRCCSISEISQRCWKRYMGNEHFILCLNLRKQRKHL